MHETTLMGDYDYKNRTMKERLDSLIELYDTELAYLDGLIKLDKLTVRKNNTELDLSTSRACLVRFIEDLNSLARNGPLFRVGQRLAFVHPVGKHNVMSVLDDNMVVSGEPEWNGQEWEYPIEGKANPSRESSLRDLGGIMGIWE